MKHPLPGVILRPNRIGNSEGDDFCLFASAGAPPGPGETSGASGEVLIVDMRCSQVPRVTHSVDSLFWLAQQLCEVSNSLPQLGNEPLEQPLSGERVAVQQHVSQQRGESEPESVLSGTHVAPQPSRAVLKIESTRSRSLFMLRPHR